jgi:S-adenosylmethionine/arginine decarboxylase-like enzyme
MVEHDEYPKIERKTAKLSGVGVKVSSNEIILEDKFDYLLDELGQTIVDRPAPKPFGPPGHGVTITRVLAESHAFINTGAALSTWPETRNGYAEIDLATCSTNKAKENFDAVLLLEFHPQELISAVFSSDKEGITHLVRQYKYTRVDSSSEFPTFSAKKIGLRNS